MTYRKNISFQERFWEKVIKTNSCWKWIATKHKFGYGMIRPGGTLDKITAHRASWIIHFGEIPKGMFVLHKCDNPECTNPEHLFLGTNLDNMLDKESKNRGNHPGKKLSPLEEIEIKNLLKQNYPLRKLSRMFQVERRVIKRLMRS